MKDKRPSFQFYPGDWKKDPELSRATKAEKGMLVDILCLMWDCEDRGILATAGIPWTSDEIALAAGGDQAENAILLEGLVRKGILRRNQSGAIFSARMVRDENKRKLCSEAGKRGGGNPTFIGTAKGALKGTYKGTSKQNTNPSSSSSASSSSSKTKTNTIGRPRDGPPDSNNGNYQVTTPVQFVVCAYKLSRGVDIEDRDWDRDNFKRCSRSAKLLLDIFRGDQEEASKCVETVKLWAERNKLDWTLETVVKRASDVKIGRLHG